VRSKSVAANVFKQGLSHSVGIEEEETEGLIADLDQAL